MGTYKVTVNARVVRTVMVEADTEEQAVIEARSEVMDQLGAYRVDVQDLVKEGEMEYQYEIGQEVMWSGSWGTRAPQPAKIIDKGDKNGQPVYDLDNGHWAYEYQLQEVGDESGRIL